MRQPELFELNAVLAIAAHRSFRAAAAQLGVSPSGLSHAVSTLERRIGVRLFNRTTRSVSLSGAGETFVARLRPALGEIAAAIESVNGYRETPSGTLRINTFESAARQALMPIVFEFVEKYPDMNVEIATESRFVDIVKEGFDAGVRLRDSIPRDMVAVPCSPPQRWAVVGSPRYFKQHGRPKHPRDLVSHRCVRLRRPNGGLYAWEFERRGRATTIAVDGPLTLDAASLVIDAAVRGVGLAYINEWEASALLESKQLVRVLEAWLPPWPPLCLYYPSQQFLSAGLRAFVDVAKKRAFAR
jgi:DNA-binding transcriptional LysR family regulator